MQATFSSVSRVFEESLTAVHEHLQALSAVVTEIAEGLDGRKATETVSPASPPRTILPVLSRLKKDAFTTPKDVTKALGFPVEMTPEDVSGVLHLFIHSVNNNSDICSSMSVCQMCCICLQSLRFCV